jgi:hypothetical protein
MKVVVAQIFCNDEYSDVHQVFCEKVIVVPFTENGLEKLKTKFPKKKWNHSELEKKFPFLKTGKVEKLQGPGKHYGYMIYSCHLNLVDLET